MLRRRTARLTSVADEHWERQAIAAMDQFRHDDPEGWAEYLREAEELDAGPALPADPWNEAA